MTRSPTTHLHIAYLAQLLPPQAMQQCPLEPGAVMGPSQATYSHQQRQLRQLTWPEVWQRVRGCSKEALTQCQVRAQAWRRAQCPQQVQHVVPQLWLLLWLLLLLLCLLRLLHLLQPLPIEAGGRFKRSI